jgi:hypothetical protein
VNAPVNRLLAQMMLGKDAEEFLASEVGRYLIGRARQESMLALRELRTVWPWRRRRIQMLQNRVAWGEAFEGWVRELVVSGRAAEATFDQMQAEYDGELYAEDDAAERPEAH